MAGPPPVSPVAEPAGSRRVKSNAVVATAVGVAGLAVVAVVLAGLVFTRPAGRGRGGSGRGEGAQAATGRDNDVAAKRPAADGPPPKSEGPAFGRPSERPTTEPARPTGEFSRAAANVDFSVLLRRIAAAGHQPRGSLDPSNPRAHEAYLCDVGDVAIALAFPSEPLPGPAAEIIACLPAGSGRWRLELRSPAGSRRDVGGLAVRDGRLVASLPAASAADQAARAAVAGAVIRITNQTDPQRHTHVQLRRAAAQPPLTFRGLAFDPRVALAAASPANVAPGAVVMQPLAAPATPWPCRAALTGRCGEAEAVVTLREEGAPFAGPDGSPTLLTAAWVSPAAPEDPFLEMTFAIEPAAEQGRVAGLRLVGAALPPAWRSHRRFGRLFTGEASATPPRREGEPPQPLLPGGGILAADCGWLFADRGEPVSTAELTAFARAIVRLNRKETPAVVTAPLVFQAPRFADRLQPLAAWLAELREELEQARGDAAIPLRMLADELVAVAAGKKLAAAVVAGLESGTAVLEGRLETFFPSLDAAAVVLHVGTVAPEPLP